MNSMLFGMKAKPKHSLIQLLQPIAQEIKQNIITLTNLTLKQWWYLNEKNKINTQTACFDPSKQFLITMSFYDGTRMFNIKGQHQELDFISLFDNRYASSICFDSSKKFLAISSHIHTDIFDVRTFQKINSFAHESGYVCIDSSEKYFAIKTRSREESFKEILIFSQYNDYTLEQLLLKKALLTWLLIEKPNKKIITLKNLMEDVALKCTIPYNLLEIWFTFPQNMQKALWRTMDYKIQKYGKDSNENCIIQ